MAGVTSARVDAAGPATQVVVEPARFTNLPRGWRAFDHDFGLLTRRGADVNSYALSRAYKPGPFGWANSMPPRAIAVTVLLNRRAPGKSTANLCGHAPHLPGFPRIRRLPLRVPRTTNDRQEGQPRVLEYRVFGRMDDSYNVDLRVDVNSLHPDAGTLRTAQAVVSAIRFPRWPRLESCWASSEALRHGQLHQRRRLPNRPRRVFRASVAARAAPRRSIPAGDEQSLL